MNAGVRTELLRRSAADQQAREMLQRSLSGNADSLPGEGELDLEGLQAMDEDNTAWLKRVVREHGWPGRSVVGDDGATAAWLLVQHADHDPAFQRECLDLMTRAVERDDASTEDWACLVDRVLRAERKPQRYGTQFMLGPDGYQPEPLEDPERVDERRAALGLGPLNEYRRHILQQYGGPATRDHRPAEPRMARASAMVSCQSGPLEVHVRTVKIPGPLRALSRMSGFRPKSQPIEHDVAMPWLPDGCSPCRYGPGLGAVRGGEAVLSWYEASEPASQPVEINWMETKGRSPQAEPATARGRTAVWASGFDGAYQAVVVLTEKGKRYVVTGTLTRDEMLHVAGTLPS